MSKVDELRAICDAATPGPWTVEEGPPEQGDWALYGPLEPMLTQKGKPYKNGAMWRTPIMREGSDYDDYGTFPEGGDRGFIETFDPMLVGQLLDVVDAARRFLADVEAREDAWTGHMIELEEAVAKLVGS